MTDLTLSERLRVAAAIGGPLTLELSHKQAVELMRICADLEGRARDHNAVLARFNAITNRHEWLCRINDEIAAPIIRLVLLLSASLVIVGLSKDLLN